MSLLTKLIKQAKNPKGFVGNTMIHIMNLAHDKQTKWALNKLKIKEDSIILDIGCGGGNTINQLSKRITNGKVYGIDYSQDCVKTSIKNNKKHVKVGTVEVSQASVSSIPYLKDSFDCITAVQTHYFWPDLKNDIQEVYRILKKNGSFMIVSELYKMNYHMEKYETVKELQMLFQEIKFNDTSVFEKKGWVCIIGVK